MGEKSTFISLIIAFGDLLKAAAWNGPYLKHKSSGNVDCLPRHSLVPRHLKAFKSLAKLFYVPSSGVMGYVCGTGR